MRVSADITDRFRKPPRSFDSSPHLTHGLMRRGGAPSVPTRRHATCRWRGAACAASASSSGYRARRWHRSSPPAPRRRSAVRGTPADRVRSAGGGRRRVHRAARAQPGCARCGHRFRSRASRSRVTNAGDRRAHMERHRDPRTGQAPEPWRAAVRADIPADRCKCRRRRGSRRVAGPVLSADRHGPAVGRAERSVIAGQVHAELFDTASGTVAGSLMFDSSRRHHGARRGRICRRAHRQRLTAVGLPATRPCTC